MRKFLVAFALMTGVAFAEYEVGDVLPVPITNLGLTISRNVVLGQVVYKDSLLYIIITPGVDTNAVSQYIAQIPPKIARAKADILTYLNISESDLYDSDNEDRIYLVISPIYVSGILRDLGIQGSKALYGYFDPTFTVSTEEYSAHEYFHLKCDSYLSPSGICNDEGFIDDRLDKFLHFLYASYALWSLDNTERIRNILRGAYYITSKADAVNDYSMGFNGESDIALDGGPYGYDGTTLIYEVASVISSDDKNAEMAYYWYNYLEEYFGESDLVDAIVAPGPFDEHFSALLEQNGLVFDSLLVDFYLKMALNGDGYGYDFTNPAFPNHPVIDIYDPLSKNVYSISAEDTIPDVSPVVQGWGALGFRTKNPVLDGQTGYLNIPDDALIKAFIIDSVEKTVTEITGKERYIFPNLQIYSRIAYLINLTGSGYNVWPSYGDSIPPTIEEFFVKPDFGALNVFNIYVISNEEICYDVGACNVLIGLKLPGVDEPVNIDVGKIDEYVDANGVHYAYYNRLELPTVREGVYKFYIADAADGAENKVEYGDTILVELGFATTGLYTAFLGDFIEVKPERDIRIAVARSSEKFYLASDVNTYATIRLAAGPNKTIYRKVGDSWEPVPTVYRDGRIEARVPVNGEYKVMSGTASSGKLTLRVAGRNVILSSPVPFTADVKIYNVNGRLVLDSRVSGSGNVSIDLKRLPAGVYYIYLNSTDAVIQRKVVLY